MCGTEVLDKDGISAAVKAREMMNYLDKVENIKLHEKLDQLYEK